MQLGKNYAHTKKGRSNMKLSVFSVLYKDKPLADVLDLLSGKGIAHVEVGAGEVS